MRKVAILIGFFLGATCCAWGTCSTIREDKFTCDNGSCHSWQYHAVCTGSGPYMCYEPCGFGTCCGVQYANACYGGMCAAFNRPAVSAHSQIARFYVPNRCRGHYSLIESEPSWQAPQESIGKPQGPSAN
jgi:hypothetical protein